MTFENLRIHTAPIIFYDNFRCISHRKILAEINKFNFNP